MDYEGRRYDGLMRHLTLCKLVMLFIAEQTAGKVDCSPCTDLGADGQGSQCYL